MATKLKLHTPAVKDDPGLKAAAKPLPYKGFEADLSVFQNPELKKDTAPGIMLPTAIEESPRIGDTIGQTNKIEPLVPKAQSEKQRMTDELAQKIIEDNAQKSEETKLVTPYSTYEQIYNAYKDQPTRSADITLDMISTELGMGKLMPSDVENVLDKFKEYDELYREYVSKDSLKVYDPLDKDAGVKAYERALNRLSEKLRSNFIDNPSASATEKAVAGRYFQLFKNLSKGASSLVTNTVLQLGTGLAQAGTDIAGGVSIALGTR